MQFFPTEMIQEQSNTISANRSSSPGGQDGSGFAGLLANYIEEGREDYCGRPAGFAAQEESSGTLSNRESENFVKALRKRNVDEENIAALELLMQKGHGLTVSNAFKALSGNGGRKTAALEGDERDAFKMLLGKMGLSKDQVDDMLGLSDEGQSAILLRNLRQTLGNMEGSVDATQEELSSMLRALDLSDATMKKVMLLFGKQGETTLSGGDMQAMLVEAGKEFALRESNNRHATQQMREAMNDALAASKAEEQAAQIDDIRGSRRSDRLKTLMDDNVLGKSGAYDIKQDFNGNGDGFTRDSNGKGLWRNLLDEGEKSVKTRNTSKLLKNVGLSGDFAALQDGVVQARNLDIVNKSVDREIFSQVEQGILQSVRNGSQRLTLQLMPEDLGKLNLVLTMKQGELKAMITAENAESAALLSEQMEELKAALEEQGIKVAELEVRTELRDNRFAEQWNGQKEHNDTTDAREHDRIMRLSRIRREAAEADSTASTHKASEAVAQGLHIVA